MTFGRPVTPLIGQRGYHGRAVALKPCRQTLHFWNPALRRPLHPTRESFLVPLLENAVEFLRQESRFGDFRRRLYQMFYEGALFSFQFLDVPKQ